MTMLCEVRVGGDREQDLREVCGGDGRWLWPAYSMKEECILLFADDDEEPMYGTKVSRVIDALSHESMHAVLHQELGEIHSATYDDCIQEVMEETTYLHRYARRQD